MVYFLEIQFAENFGKSAKYEKIGKILANYKTAKKSVNFIGQKFFWKFVVS